jgi:hypothetical protein
MKKKVIMLFILGVLSAAYANLSQAERTGHWMPLYHGKPTVQEYVCIYHWWYSDCVEGDTRKPGGSQTLD